MKRFFYLLAILFFLVLFSGCGDDPEKDDQLPVIDMSGNNAFPQNCTTVYRGESFIFQAVFTDNAELGSFSINIYHNFDHHTHSTDITDCELDPVKAPVNPFLLIEEQEITPGNTTYTAYVEIDVPDDVDKGDYHFMVKLIDAEG
jgi:hypothetical protein